MTIIYELDANSRSRFSAVQEAFGKLATTSRIWRITSKASTYDWKRNAGSGTLIDRKPVRCGPLCLPAVSTNVSVIGLDLGEIRIYPLPDQILFWQSGKFAPINYSDLSISFHRSRFVEDERVPPDAQVVDQTWRYVNKNGNPDLRFNNNKCIPVVAYGSLIFASKTGVNLDFQVSSLEAASKFSLLLNLSGEKAQSQRRTDIHSNQEPQLSQREKAADVLGIERDAGIEKISAAYHHLAQMYHPDKVAGLAPEFKTIADQKMKEINLAYAVLKRALML